jgi:alkaline phosphatase
MIEGSQIDWGGHANETNYIVSELLEFDRVIHNVLKWAKADGNTLVVVTADHETGGMTINKGSTRDSLVVKYTSDYHTGTMIPVFAFGPYESLFRGIYENTSIYYKMKEALGWQTNEASRKTKEQ